MLKTVASRTNLVLDNSELRGLRSGKVSVIVYKIFGVRDGDDLRKDLRTLIALSTQACSQMVTA